MKCTRCHQAIRPGLQIVVDELSNERAYCPYCLEILAPDSLAEQKTSAETSVECQARRRKIRQQFINRCTEFSNNGRPRCPMCEHVLNTVETGLLCDNEYFRCPLCHTDLATLAYQQEAYHEQRWLPVILALGDLCIDKKCRDCCYLAAIAKSCWSAFSWMPSADSKSIQPLARLFQTSPQTIPDCDWQSCLAVKQYQKLAGDGLRIL